MPPINKRRKKPAEATPKAEGEIVQLEQRIKDESPARGWSPTPGSEAKFASLPISARTILGLNSAKFETMKPIQQAAIPHALAGRDVLGAARTGSGKTLAFVIPALELLYREKWSGSDGLGVLIISPTRELALQTFEVLRVVGSKHDISAGLVTGGKRDIDAEKLRVGKMCLLVATPGRVLHHLEETPGFDASRVLALVIDEADRIVDMGFSPQLQAIVNYLPSERHTMLFSATLTGPSVSISSGPSEDTRLGRLKNLVDASTVEFVVAQTEGEGVLDSNAKAPTPKLLQQCYVKVNLDDKLDVVHSFIKSHTKAKSIIFVSACAQARYLHEALRGLQPGVPLSSLHGKLSQQKRTAVYIDFCQKEHAVLFATDVASRGLDFQGGVDWVVQLDAPEDAECYVHRVGRAARNKRKGDAMLVLLPSEEARVVEWLREARVPINKLSVNPAHFKKHPTKAHVSALLAQRPEMRALAERAFKSYVRSVALARDKAAFAVGQLPLAAFAASLGLAAAPRLKLPSADDAAEASHDKKNSNRKLDKLKMQIKAQKELKKAQRDGATIDGATIAAKPRRPAVDDDEEDDDGELVLVSESRKRAIPEAEPASATAALAKRKLKKLKLNAEGVEKSRTAQPRRTLFDDDGVAKQGIVASAAAESIDLDKLRTANDDFVARVQQRLRESAHADRAGEKERTKAAKLKRKLDKAKQDDGSGSDDSGGGQARLGGGQARLAGDSGDDEAAGESDDDDDD
ncbi:P-loop containing nucleoside triphosphate hydrolase protein [Pelagophyceae sp. CCMP2097]|nr:P-loop containing nucleoside triphosphate hydrolase protein [Pelagophyceae sp. CCMP2097]